MGITKVSGSGDIKMRGGPLRRRLYRLIDRIDVYRSGGRYERSSVPDPDTDRVVGIDGDTRGDGRAFDGGVGRDAAERGQDTGLIASDAADRRTD